MGQDGGHARKQILGGELAVDLGPSEVMRRTILFVVLVTCLGCAVLLFGDFDKSHSRISGACGFLCSFVGIAILYMENARYGK